MVDNAQLHTLAMRMRVFLEEKFWPNGASGGRCAETSVFVTQVINDTFEPANWRSVAGRYDRYGYHCWSTNDKLIVDLTADQFGADENPKVLIRPVNDYRYLADCTNNAHYRDSKRYYELWKHDQQPHYQIWHAMMKRGFA